MSQRILSIHEAPFDAAAGVVCSTDENILEQWENYRLTVCHRQLSDDILGFLQKDSTIERMYAITDIKFDVSIGWDMSVHLHYREPLEHAHPESIKNNTNFFDLFGHDKEGKAFVMDVETQARRAGRSLGERDLKTRIRTVTSGIPKLHIDGWTTLAAIYAKLTTVVAHPASVSQPTETYDLLKPPFYDWPDRKQMRKLEQGDVCIIGEIPHGPDDGDPHFDVYREGPWIGFYSYATRNPSFVGAGIN